MVELLSEENRIYAFDCSMAVWATNQVNAIYHQAGVHLKDADFIIEDEKNLLIVEYKNAKIPGAVHPERFNPSGNKSIETVIQKFYDTMHYLYLAGKDKAPIYVYVLEAPASDCVMRKRLRNRMQKGLPFQLQKDMGNKRKLISGVDVVSIQEWNDHIVYGKYPIIKIHE